MAIQIFHEGVRIQFLHIPHTGSLPLFLQHHLAPNHGWHAGSVGDSLGTYLIKGLFVAADIINVNLFLLVGRFMTCFVEMLEIKKNAVKMVN